MKQKDWIIIIVTVFISAVASFFISRALFASPEDRMAEVEIVEPILAEFQQPDDRYFNEDSINPSQSITIGEDDNPQPFSDSN